MKTIFVNATATTTGGGLIILQQFLETLPIQDTDNVYYVFCAADAVNNYNGSNIKIINNIYKRKWIGRILWDNFGIEKWMKNCRVKPDLIVSFQNTGVRLGRRIKQIIYYHQSIPMYEYQWSLIKKQERKLWIYKNIYPWFVKKHFYADDVLVVQSSWMKEASSKVLDIPLDRIRIIKPTIQLYGHIKASPKRKSERESFNIFYPASGVAFKNHKIIYDALIIIANTRKELFKNIKFYITLENDEKLHQYNSELNENIIFLGQLEYSKLLEFYPQMDLMVFPSYLETVGLPLLEAAYFGLEIIASDLPYAMEAVSEYNGASFVKHDDARTWADAIISAYENQKKYDGFLPNQNNSWEDMFLLIKQQLM